MTLLQDEKGDPRALIRYAILFAIVALGAAWALYAARRALILIYISALLAIGFSPVVRFIENQNFFPRSERRLPHWVAALLLYAAIFGGACLVAYAVLPTVIHQAQGLAGQLPDLLDHLESFLARTGILQRGSLGELLKSVPAGPKMLSAVVFTFWNLIGGLFGALVIFILSLYLLIESDDFIRQLVLLFPRERRPAVRSTCDEVTERVSAWLIGQLILAAIIGSTTAIALGLMGLPYFYVLALIAAVGELIPYAGPVLAAIPAIGVALTQSWQLALAVLVFFVVQQQAENHLLVPNIMQHQVRLNAATLIIAILIGSSLLSVVGAILAVPSAAVLTVIFERLE